MNGGDYSLNQTFLLLVEFLYILSGLYHLTCRLSGGSDCCSRVFPSTSSSSRALTAEVGALTGAWGVVTDGNSTAAGTGGTGVSTVSEI